MPEDPRHQTDNEDGQQSLTGGESPGEESRERGRRRSRRIGNAILSTVFLLIGVLAVVGVLGVRQRRKSKIAREIKRKEILTSFQDVTSILHLVVIHKYTGADIFDYKVQERLDPTLLAGFIQAVKEFGKELDTGGRQR